MKALGAIILSESPLPKPSPTVAARAMLEAIAEEGFEAIGAGDVVRETLARIAMLETAGCLDETGWNTVKLVETASDWLFPLLKRKGAQVPAPHAVREALIASLDRLSAHPTLASGRVPVTVEMLSPGRKPVATTQDLGRFWGAGYLDMAKDMRGRYPKHDWPSDPANAKAHEGRTKKRL